MCDVMVWLWISRLKPNQTEASCFHTVVEGRHSKTHDILNLTGSVCHLSVICVSVRNFFPLLRRVKTQTESSPPPPLSADSLLSLHHPPETGSDPSAVPEQRRCVPTAEDQLTVSSAAPQCNMFYGGMIKKTQPVSLKHTTLSHKLHTTGVQPADCSTSCDVTSVQSASDVCSCTFMTHQHTLLF